MTTHGSFATGSTRESRLMGYGFEQPFYPSRGQELPGYRAPWPQVHPQAYGNYVNHMQARNVQAATLYLQNVQPNVPFGWNRAPFIAQQTALQHHYVPYAQRPFNPFPPVYHFSPHVYTSPAYSHNVPYAYPPVRPPAYPVQPYQPYQPVRPQPQPQIFVPPRPNPVTPPAPHTPYIPPSQPQQKTAEQLRKEEEAKRKQQQDAQDAAKKLQMQQEEQRKEAERERERQRVERERELEQQRQRQDAENRRQAAEKAGKEAAQSGSRSAEQLRKEAEDRALIQTGQHIQAGIRGAVDSAMPVIRQGAEVLSAIAKGNVETIRKEERAKEEKVRREREEEAKRLEQYPGKDVIDAYMRNPDRLCDVRKDPPTGRIQKLVVTQRTDEVFPHERLTPEDIQSILAGHEFGRTENISMRGMSFSPAQNAWDPVTQRLEAPHGDYEIFANILKDYTAQLKPETVQMIDRYNADNRRRCTVEFSKKNGRLEQLKIVGKGDDRGQVAGALSSLAVALQGVADNPSTAPDSYIRDQYPHVRVKMNMLTGENQQKLVDALQADLVDANVPEIQSALDALVAINGTDTRLSNRLRVHVTKRGVEIFQNVLIGQRGQMDVQQMSSLLRNHWKFRADALSVQGRNCLLFRRERFGKEDLELLKTALQEINDNRPAEFQPALELTDDIARRIDAYTANPRRQVDIIRVPPRGRLERFDVRNRADLPAPLQLIPEEFRAFGIFSSQNTPAQAAAIQADLVESRGQYGSFLAELEKCRIPTFVTEVQMKAIAEYAADPAALFDVRLTHDAFRLSLRDPADTDALAVLQAGLGQLQLANNGRVHALQDDQFTSENLIKTLSALASCKKMPMPLEGRNVIGTYMLKENRRFNVEPVPSPDDVRRIVFRPSDRTDPRERMTLDALQSAVGAAFPGRAISVHNGAVVLSGGLLPTDAQVLGVLLTRQSPQYDLPETVRERGFAQYVQAIGNHPHCPFVIRPEPAGADGLVNTITFVLRRPLRIEGDDVSPLLRRDGIFSVTRDGGQWTVQLGNAGDREAFARFLQRQTGDLPAAPTISEDVRPVLKAEASRRYGEMLLQRQGDRTTRTPEGWYRITDTHPRLWHYEVDFRFHAGRWEWKSADQEPDKFLPVSNNRTGSGRFSYLPDSPHQNIKMAAFNRLADELAFSEKCDDNGTVVPEQMREFQKAYLRAIPGCVETEKGYFRLENGGHTVDIYFHPDHEIWCWKKSDSTGLRAQTTGTPNAFFMAIMKTLDRGAFSLTRIAGDELVRPPENDAQALRDTSAINRVERELRTRRMGEAYLRMQEGFSVTPEGWLAVSRIGTLGFGVNVEFRFVKDHWEWKTRVEEEDKFRTVADRTKRLDASIPAEDALNKIMDALIIIGE